MGFTAKGRTNPRIKTTTRKQFFNITLPPDECLIESLVADRDFDSRDIGKLCSGAKE